MAKGATGRAKYEAEKAKKIADKYFDLDSSSEEGEEDERDDATLDVVTRARRAAGHTTDTLKEPERLKPLTAKEGRFVEEYFVDFNATQAAIRAGYSEKTAAAIGYENLRKPHIARAVEFRRRELARKADFNAEALLARLIEELHADIADLYDERTGGLKPVHEWPLVWRTGLIAGVETAEIGGAAGVGGEEGVTLGFIRKVKMSDRTKRLDMLGKHILIQAWNLRKTLDVKVNPYDEIRQQLAGTGLRPTQIEATARDVTAGGHTLRPRE